MIGQYDTSVIIYDRRLPQFPKDDQEVVLCFFYNAVCRVLSNGLLFQVTRLNFSKIQYLLVSAIPPSFLPGLLPEILLSVTNVRDVLTM